MKSKNFQSIFLALTLVLSLGLFVGCSDDDNENDPEAIVRINGSLLVEINDYSGDIDGDFEGNGATDSRTFTWVNNLSTADYNADITATTEGSFNMIVRDAEGSVVLDRSLTGGMEPDSFSGTTSAGVSGEWTVTITLDSFNGDGSFSLSEGN